MLLMMMMIGKQELGLLYPSKELALQTILWVSVDEDKDGR